MQYIRSHHMQQQKEKNNRSFPNQLEVIYLEDWIKKSFKIQNFTIEKSWWYNWVFLGYLVNFQYFKGKPKKTSWKCLGKKECIKMDCIILYYVC